MRYFVGDFETTVYEGQKQTEVWASAVVEMKMEDVKIFHSIEETWDYLKSIAKQESLTIFYHNLKFDGNFWLSYFITKLHMKQAYKVITENPFCCEWIEDSDMLNNTFKYSISAMGQWYNIVVKVNGNKIIFRDSLKLLPFSVSRIGKSFGTKHKKLDMEYEGYRYAGCEITDEEKKYIANDVLVIREALDIMFDEGHTSLTIGSCCLKEFKQLFLHDDNICCSGREEMEKVFFPDIYQDKIDESLYGSPNAGEYIRKSYRGGWCYVAKNHRNKRYKHGATFDVNSLYPSMMSSESGNYFPIGHPKFWKGDYIPDEAKTNPDGNTHKYFFVRIRTRFYLLEGMLPFIQLRNTSLYMDNEALETSDIYDRKTGQYYQTYIDTKGIKHDSTVTLTLTCTDYYLLRDHYVLKDFEILDGCYFFARIGIFDSYINKYKKIKMESKGARRELAKLFLNNLCGKMATNQDSSFKVAYEKEDGSLGFYIVGERNKKAGYIPIGSAITSYARNFTIRSAQKNYKHFIYADTDSIHCDCREDEIKGIKIHDKNFCCWKCESYWDEAIFVRQKTYIEHITHEDQKEIDKKYYNIKCAGMPQRCKDIFNANLTGVKPENLKPYTEQQIKAMEEHKELEDFKIGLKIEGKLMPKRINGGIILAETTFEMR